MIICFHCAQETKIKLDQLLASGQYDDYGDLIESAILNLHVLHGELNEGDVLVIQDNSTTSRHELLSNSRPSILHSALNNIEDQNPPVRTRQGLMAHAEIPTLFQLSSTYKAHLEPAKMPGDVWSLGQKVPVDRWLFGQFNRLLPAKASCRALLNLQRESPNGVNLADGSMVIAEYAATLGTFLTSLDKKAGNPRDVALSTAFPSEGEESIKSRMRYATQFVGNLNRAGQLSGLLVGLKLINLAVNPKKHVMLTRPGMEFAALTNPVLDNPNQTPIKRFGNDEIRFLLSHISNEVPAEDSAYRTILELIADGHTTPGSIDQALKSDVPSGRKSKVSSSYLASQRSGAISRMGDLSLIERVREGVKVSYVLTHLGRKYLDGRLFKEE